MVPPGDIGQPALVIWKSEPVQKADGQRLDTMPVDQFTDRPGHLIFVERRQHLALGRNPLIDFQTPLTRH